MAASTEAFARRRTAFAPPRTAPSGLRCPTAPGDMSSHLRDARSLEAVTGVPDAWAPGGAASSHAPSLIGTCQSRSASRFPVRLRNGRQNGGPWRAANGPLREKPPSLLIRGHADLGHHVCWHVHGENTRGRSQPARSDEQVDVPDRDVHDNRQPHRSRRVQL